MKSERFVITDNVWEKIWRHLPGIREFTSKA